MGSLKILSVNCQGLGDLSKRRDVFSFLKSGNHNIYCLQDTHFTVDKENSIRTLRGYECYFSSFSSNSRGVAIMFKNNFEWKVLKEKRDIDGNYLALDLVVDKVRFTLITIYGPNTDSPFFYEHIMSIIDDFENECFIICGDFNLVLNPNLDCYNYLHINNPNARDKLLELIDDRSLVDPYRELFPDLCRYTWRKKSPFKQARLDFFLFSENILSFLKNCCVEPSYRSDHSRIILELELNPFIRGKGLWKFNNSLLYDADYVNVMKEKILDVKKQYAALVYNFDNINEVNNNDLHFTINSQLFLETLLMEVRGKTISYSSFKKKERERREKTLKDDINILEENVNSGSIQQLEDKKNELEKFRKEKMHGKIVRSRIQWIEEGEKPTSYFCGLESKNFTSKIIPKVEKENGDIVTNQKEILKQVKIFDENLYKNRDVECFKPKDIENSLQNVNVRKLSLDEQDKLEGEISVDEAG